MTGTSFLRACNGGLGQQHVFGAANKTHRDEIRAMLQCEYQIFMVFRSQRGNLQFDAGQIDALMLAKFAAIDDRAQHRIRRRRKHAQLDQSVAQQNAVAARNVARHALVGRAHAFTGAATIDRVEIVKRCPARNWTGCLSTRAPGADFRSLKIGKNADRLR